MRRRLCMQLRRHLAAAHFAWLPTGPVPPCRDGDSAGPSARTGLGHSPTQSTTRTQLATRDRRGQALTRYSRASCCNFIDSVEHSPSGKLARHQPLGSRSTTRHNHAIRRSTRGLSAYPLDQYDLTQGSRSTSSTL
jgi:hypothetical protein